MKKALFVKLAIIITVLAVSVSAVNIPIVSVALEKADDAVKNSFDCTENSEATVANKVVPVKLSTPGAKKSGETSITSTDDYELPFISNETEHDWNEGVITAPPTCTEPGIKTYTCRLNASHTYTEEIPATGHDWGEWVRTTEPTETEPGEEIRTCNNNPMHTETREIPPLGPSDIELSFYDEEIIIFVPKGAVPEDSVFSVRRTAPPPPDISDKVQEQCGSYTTLLVYYEIRLNSKNGPSITYLDGDIIIKTKMPEEYVGNPCVKAIQEDETGTIVTMPSWWEGDYLCYNTNWLEIYN